METVFRKTINDLLKLCYWYIFLRHWHLAYDIFLTCVSSLVDIFIVEIVDLRTFGTLCNE